MKVVFIMWILETLPLLATIFPIGYVKTVKNLSIYHTNLAVSVTVTSSLFCMLKSIGHLITEHLQLLNV